MKKQYTLDLAPEDIIQFSKLAYQKGTTPEELLQGFISDLVDGSQSNGPDERMYARQYLDRCGYDMMPKTFLSWALNEYRLEEITDLLETLHYAEGDLAYYAKNPADPDGNPEFIAELEQTRKEAEQELSGIYKEYAEDMERQQDTAQPMDKGIQDIRAYNDRLKSVKKCSAKAARKEINNFVEKADRPKKKTGPKSIVTPEDAAYIHELLSSGSSLQAIADRLTADYTSDDGEVQKHFSKSLIQKVSKQEPPKGKWFSGSDESKIFYDNFREALRSGKQIHFEAESPLS